MILYLLVSTLSLCCVQRLKSIWHIFLFPSFHLFYPIFLSAYIFVLSLELEIWNWNLNGKGKKVLRPLSKFWFDRGAIKNFHLSFFYQLFLPWKSIKQQKIKFFFFSFQPWRSIWWGSPMLNFSINTLGKKNK